MADKSIVELQKVEELQPQSSIPVYQDGTAKRVTGEQLVQMANVETQTQVDQATNAAAQAAASAESAQLSATAASQAVLNSPQIQNGTWWVYNKQTNAYQDTGIAATGPQGPMGGVDNFVRYDAPQSLIDEQKAQARGNINAAPDGFGLGGNATNIPAGADLNSYVKTGRYAQGTTSNMRQILNLPDAFSNGGIVVDVLAIKSTYVAQIAYNLRDNKDIITAMRQNYVGTWQPWEYVNPPRELGVEYRTTERCLGRPVYVKAVDCSPLTDGKSVPHGITDLNFIFYAQGTRGSSPLPLIYNHNLSDPWSCYISSIDRTNIVLRVGSSAANANSIVILKYTKTTD